MKSSIKPCLKPRQRHGWRGQIECWICHQKRTKITKVKRPVKLSEIPPELFKMRTKEEIQNEITALDWKDGWNNDKPSEGWGTLV